MDLVVTQLMVKPTKKIMTPKAIECHFLFLDLL